MVDHRSDKRSHLFINKSAKVNSIVMHEPQLPNVSVIVPVYMDNGRLRNCLVALHTQDYPSDKIEIIVVDNNFEQSVFKEKNSYDYKIVWEPKPGSYSARNAGIKVATGELLAFTDADCIPHVNWLRSGVEYFVGVPGNKSRIVGGEIRVIPRCWETPNSVEAYDVIFGLRQRRYVERGDFAATANLFVPRCIFDNVGSFDEELMSSGDSDWCNRAVRLGYQVSYCANAVVDHPARMQIRDILIKARRLKGGQYLLSRKDIPWKGIRASKFEPLRILFSHPIASSFKIKIGVLCVAFLVAVSMRMEEIRLLFGMKHERK